MPNRLGALQRVHSSREFRQIYQQARRIPGAYYVAYVLRRADQQRSRMGVSVSKKRGNAVYRNMAKRLAREAFRTGNLAPGLTVIWVLCRTGERSYLAQDLQTLLERIRDRG